MGRLVYRDNGAQRTLTATAPMSDALPLLSELQHYLHHPCYERAFEVWSHDKGQICVRMRGGGCKYTLRVMRGEGWDDVVWESKWRSMNVTDQGLRREVAQILAAAPVLARMFFSDGKSGAAAHTARFLGEGTYGCTVYPAPNIGCVTSGLGSERRFTSVAKLLSDRDELKSEVRLMEHMRRIDPDGRYHPKMLSHCDSVPSSDISELRLCARVQHVEGIIVSQYGGKTLSRAADMGIDRGAQIALFAQCAAALRHLHQHGTFHIDFKENNAVWDMRDGKLRGRLIDFGLSALSLSQLVLQTSRESFLHTYRPSLVSIQNVSDRFAAGLSEVVVDDAVGTEDFLDAVFSWGVYLDMKSLLDAMQRCMGLGRTDLATLREGLSKKTDRDFILALNQVAERHGADPAILPTTGAETATRGAETVLKDRSLIKEALFMDWNARSTPASDAALRSRWVPRVTPVTEQDLRDAKRANTILTRMSGHRTRTAYLWSAWRSLFEQVVRDAPVARDTAARVAAQLLSVADYDPEQAQVDALDADILDWATRGRVWRGTGLFDLYGSRCESSAELLSRDLSQVVRIETAETVRTPDEAPPLADKSALLRAVRTNNLSAVRRAVEAGGDPKAKFRGQSAMDIATGEVADFLRRLEISS